MASDQDKPEVNIHPAVRAATRSGNAALLKSKKLGLLCSARCPGTVIVQTLDLALALRDTAATIAGGFHSSMEKECLDTLLRGKHPVIVCPARSIQAMRMPAAWKQAIVDGALLITSPFETKYRRVTKELAEQRNRFVVSLADEIIVAHASPGGKLERLCQEMPTTGKPCWTLDDPANSHLILLGFKAMQPADATTLWPRGTSQSS